MALQSRLEVIAKIEWKLQRLLSKTSLFCASAFFVKLSLFLLYLRLFKPDKVTRWLVYGGIFVSGLFYLSTTISGVVISIPSHGHLDNDAVWLAHFIQQGHKLEILAITLSVFGVFSDIYLLVIPIRSIFQLQLPIHRKFGISSIFLIGILWVINSLPRACSGCAKLVESGLFYALSGVFIFVLSSWTWVMSNGSQSRFGSFRKSWPFRKSVRHLWKPCSVAEICAGIICSCMPILKALFSDRARHKSPFASLTAFLSRFNLRGIRQPLMSEQSTSFDKLSSDPVDSHLDGKRDDSIKLKSGIESTNLNEAVWPLSNHKCLEELVISAVLKILLLNRWQYGNHVIIFYSASPSRLYQIFSLLELATPR